MADCAEAEDTSRRASLARIMGPKHLLKETKTGKTRQTPIIAPLKDLLLEQRSRQAAWKMLCSNYDPAGWANARPTPGGAVWV